MKSLSRRTATALLLHVTLAASAWFALPLNARAQHEATNAPSDVPAGSATIRGRVVHAQRPGAAADLEVVLYALPPGGIPGVRRARTDASGAFAFREISNDATIPYLVGARFADVPFPGERVVFERGETEHEVEVRISDASTDGSAIEVLSVQLELTRTASGLHVEETQRLRNRGSQVFYVKPDQREARPAGWRTLLPPGATPPQHPLGITPEGMRTSGTRLEFFGPIYSGEQDLSYRYDVSLAAGDAVLARRLPAGADRVRVLAGPGVTGLHAEGFRAIDPVTIDDRSLPAIEARDVARDREIALAFELSALRSDPGLLAIDEIQIQIELDEEALLFARERWALRVEGTTPLLGSAQAPLLRLPLPAGAESIRFSTETQALGLAAGDDGSLVLTGPVGPGEVAIEVLYRLPLRGGDVQFDRRFERGTPLLSVFVADTGVVAESARLHRRRPIRTEDGPYMIHLEAFDVEAGESVPLLVRALPPRAPGRSRTVLAGVLVLAAGAVAILLAPLSSRRRGESRDTELPPERRERESLYAALRDLEDDFETGKVSADDHAQMREDLRARARALLEAERATERALAPADAANDATARCATCGATTRRDDRFCAQCGTRIDGTGDANGISA